MIDGGQGLILCGRYSFAPNSLHYCGPERQRDLSGYVRHRVADGGLEDILHKFETLYPYLVLIASENHIRDPFDPRVVEAYWLGNPLLQHVKHSSLARHMEDEIGIRRKLPYAAIAPMMDQVTLRGVPQHNFHVLNVYVRTGHNAIPHTLPTMDSCRISWGKVTDLVDRTNVIAETRPLIFRKNKLLLGAPEKRHITDVGMHPGVGDWVSIHWGYVCDVLTVPQRKNLAYYTRLAIDTANRSHILG